jgi:RHS repeat-associated protein
VTDQHGKVHEHVEYFPYGEIWREPKSDRDGAGVKGQRFLFSGKELDEETGLYYFGARYYDPVRVRWASADPLQSLRPELGMRRLKEMNVYGYAAGSPVTLVDPDGLATKSLSEKQLAEIRKEGWKEGETTSCFTHARKASVAAAAAEQKGNSLAGSDTAIGVADTYKQQRILDKWKDKGPEGAAYVAQTDIVVNPAAAKNAVAYAKTLIDKGLPVLVGVNVEGHKYAGNQGEITDHFMVLHGYETDDATGAVSRFFGTDNAVSGTVEMTFGVNPATGKISRTYEGSMPSPFTQSAYQVDQMRQWSGVAPSSQAGVGALLQ